MKRCEIYRLSVRASFLLCCLGFAVNAQASEARGAAIVPSVSTPHVDHHQHLTSPLLASVVDGPVMLPAIDLPYELKDLLQRRVTSWNDADALTGLFASDATTLGMRRRGWVSGGASVAQTLASLFARPYGMQPTQLRLSENSAELGGYYTRLQGDDPQVGYFQLNLRRDQSGRWLIQDELPRFPVPPAKPVVDGAELIRRLDAAGIRRAVVLSESFWFDGPLSRDSDAYARVTDENDWTAREAERFPDRLVAVCSFNPVADHALTELDRCARSGRFGGLKFSFAMSGVDLKIPEHLRRVRAVFTAAERWRLPIVVHLRGPGSYGAEDVELFLDQVMSQAPTIPVQIAHLWGGEGFSGPALGAFAEAVSSRRDGAANLWFDVAEVWLLDSPADLEPVTARIRQIGVDRILFGSDAQAPPAEAWRLFRQRLPLTPAEFDVIATNKAPYSR